MIYMQPNGPIRVRTWTAKGTSELAVALTEPTGPQLGEDAYFFYHYGVLVAAFVPGLGAMISPNRYSPTTTRVARQWAEEKRRCPWTVDAGDDLDDILAAVLLEAIAPTAKIEYKYSDVYRRLAWQKERHDTMIRSIGKPQ